MRGEFVAVCSGHGSEDSSFVHSVASSDATFAVIEAIASGMSIRDNLIAIST